MDTLIQKLKALSSANEFLEFFGISYDEHVVHVNRLHILKPFDGAIETAHLVHDGDQGRRVDLAALAFE